MMLQRLARGILENEVSALRRCQRQAAQLGRSAPAAALLAIAAHAQGTLAALTPVCQRDGLSTSVERGLVGSAFGQPHDKLADLAVVRESSYLATLSEIRDGLDVMRIACLSAGAASRRSLARFCSAWLATRAALLMRAEAELRWFAQDAEIGIQITRARLGA